MDMFLFFLVFSDLTAGHNMSHFSQTLENRQLFCAVVPLFLVRCGIRTSTYVGAKVKTRKRVDSVLGGFGGKKFKLTWMSRWKLGSMISKWGCNPNIPHL